MGWDSVWLATADRQRMLRVFRPPARCFVDKDVDVVAVRLTRASVSIPGAEIDE